MALAGEQGESKLSMQLVTSLLHEMQALSDEIQHTSCMPGGLFHGSFSRQSAETEAKLSEIERRIGIPLPPELREFFATYGSFYSHVDGDGMVVGFFRRPSYPALCGGLAQVLHASWGWGSHWDEEDFPKNAVDAMNTNYVVFGHFMETEDRFQHFYFDRQGHFGSLRFDQDSSDADALRHLRELRDGVNRHRMTFSQLLTPYVQAALKSTQEARALYSARGV
jgi:hypothetical protein